MDRKKYKRESAEERLRRVYRQRLIVAGIGCLVVLYLCGALWHVFHFQRNTTINGINVSGKSVRKAKAAFQAAAEDYTLTVRGLDGSESVFSDPHLELTVTDPAGLRQTMRHQSALNWFFGGFFKKEYLVDVTSSYQKTAVEQYLDDLEWLDGKQMTQPTDAVLHEDEDGFVSIVPEQEGSELDIEAAKTGIRTAVGNYHQTLDLSEFQVHPVVYQDDPNLKERMETWNGYLKAAGISFTMPKEQVTLDSKAIAKLLRDDGESVSVSYTLVADLMSKWKDEYDTYANKFRFQTTNGDEVTIMPWGDYGYQLDEEGTAKTLIQAIKDGDAGSHEASWFKKGNSMDNMGLGGTYVEVSIEEQHLWVYKDGKLVVDTDVVTGNPNPDEKGKNRQTYLGCYAIKDKMKDVTLGTLDVQGYESPVKYWVPFNGGEGFHDAPWREYFGGRIYQSNGSHGCVNCPPEVMGTIYKNVEEGEPVVIY